MSTQLTRNETLALLRYREDEAIRDIECANVAGFKRAAANAMRRYKRAHHRRLMFEQGCKISVPLPRDAYELAEVGFERLRAKTAAAAERD